MGCVAPVYRPRDAEHTVLHQVVAEHLEAFLGAVAEAGDGAGLPQFVEREFREFLLCGVYEAGVARFQCEGCAREHLVPFSCKGRGWFPSCGGRRMTERAAHLVDAVLPWVPVRQWVLTVPYRLRYQMAWNHGLSRAVLRVYTRVLGDVYRRGARARGIDVSSGAGAERRRGGGGAGDDPPPRAAAAGAPRPGAGGRRDGAGGSARRRVPGAGGDRGGLGAGAGGAGLACGGASAAARRRARHGDRDVARAPASATRGLRSARQRVGASERSGGAGASVPLCLASALCAGAPAAAERRAHRTGAEDAVARRHARAGVRAAGVVGASGGDDAAAGNEPADLPRSVGRARCRDIVHPFVKYLESL